MTWYHEMPLFSMTFYMVTWKQHRIKMIQHAHIMYQYIHYVQHAQSRDCWRPLAFRS